MSKTGTTDSIRSKIADLIAGRAKTEGQIAELRRQEQWAAGEERRQRLAGYAQEAEQLAATATDTSAEIVLAAQAVTDNIRRLTQLVEGHNTALDLVRSKITGEGVRGSHTPPSPMDGSVGVNNGAVIIGERHIVAVNARELVDSAVRAANTPDESPRVPSTVVDRPMWAGRFYRSRTSGSVFPGDKNPNPNDCDEITRAEYLAHAWQINLSDLPKAVLDELNPADRARVAGRVLDELDGDARNEFAQQLLPTAKENTK
jgi:hypothetical protein